jgi:hypothetical protein
MNRKVKLTWDGECRLWGLTTTPFLSFFLSFLLTLLIISVKKKFGGGGFEKLMKKL